VILICNLPYIFRATILVLSLGRRELPEMNVLFQRINQDSLFNANADFFRFVKYIANGL